MKKKTTKTAQFAFHDFESQGVLKKTLGLVPNFILTVPKQTRLKFPSIVPPKAPLILAGRFPGVEQIVNGFSRSTTSEIPDPKFGTVVEPVTIIILKLPGKTTTKPDYFAEV